MWKLIYLGHFVVQIDLHIVNKQIEHIGLGFKNNSDTI